MAAPATSVIICTRDRPDSFQRALASVLAQDASAFEVIVVDGSDPPVSVPRDARLPIRVIQGERRGEGHARSEGLCAAQGELVAWCDDDDEWAPDYLRELRHLLQRRQLDLVYAGDASHAPGGGHAQRFRHAPPGFLVRASNVIHRAEAARRAGGFDTQLAAYAAGDLWARIAALAGGRVTRCPIPAALSHAVPSAIDPRAREAALARLRADWAGTADALRGSRARLRRRSEAVQPFDPATWSDGRRELLLQTTASLPASFAIVARALVPALRELGVRVTLGTMREKDLPAGWEDVTGPLEPQNRLCLVYDPRTGAGGSRAERVVYYDMWTTSQIPQWQVEEINAAATLHYVPCRESARIARENGIVPAARVLSHGVDGTQFPVLPRRRATRTPFTFGSIGAFHIGKGIDVLIRAFQEEFSPREPVRLLLKHSYGDCVVNVPDDPRIRLVHEFFDQPALLEFLRRLDAYVLPSRGEGFGLTGLEAMATGLPVIATNWSGPADYLDPADSFPLRYQLVEAGGAMMHRRRYWGRWAEPDVAHLRDLLRYLYEHPEEAAAAGERAATRVRRDWTWGRVAQQLVDDFDLLAQGISPAPDG